MLSQNFDSLGVIREHGYLKRRPSLAIPGISLCTMREEKPYHSAVPRSRGGMQRVCVTHHDSTTPILIILSKWEGPITGIGVCSLLNGKECSLDITGFAGDKKGMRRLVALIAA